MIVTVQVILRNTEPSMKLVIISILNLQMRKRRIERYRLMGKEDGK